jgi:heterodisulfide reductase subunit A-like polyferredoxin
MTAALNLADQGFGVYLVEREEDLGGRMRHIHHMADGSDPQAFLRELADRTRSHDDIEVLTDHEVVKTSGFVGNFKTTVARPGDPRQRLLEHGVTIVATGGDEYRGSAYLLGRDEVPPAGGNVITQGDLDEQLADGHLQLETCRSVVMIQCVGPWDDDPSIPFYCSRVCCSVAVKNAIAIKDRRPDTQVVVLFKEMRTYGFQEALYTAARRKGVIFVRYDDQTKPQVQREDGRLRVSVMDPALGEELILQPDLLVLSEAVVPANGSRDLAELMKFSCTLEGFFLEAHVKLRPVDFPAEGLFLCGTAHYPKLLNEAISQAQAAAARAATILSRDALEVGGVVAVVEAEKCTGCLTCVRICPYNVPRIDPTRVGAGGIRGVAEIEAAACQGCGICAGECPAKAIQLDHYRDEQVLAQEGALFDGALIA